jgi:hypothetical protein
MDTKVGRFTREGIKVALAWKAKGDIGQIAVVGLGNNFTPGAENITSEIDDMMNVFADTEHVIWFTAAEYRPEQAEVNAALRAAATRYPKLVLVDWDAWYESQRRFTGRDHLHLTPKGAAAYSSLIAAAVTKVTQAADETPAGGATAPRMYTKGVIPGSGPGSATSGSSTTKGTTRSTSSTTRRRTTTTAQHRSSPTTAPSPAAPTAPTPTTPPGTTPPGTTPPTSPTTP